MTFKEPLIGIGGAAVGSLVTYYICNKFYKKKLNERIADVIQSYERIRNAEDEEEKTKEAAAFAKKKPDMSIYAEVLKKDDIPEKKEPPARKERERIDYHALNSRAGIDFVNRTLKKGIDIPEPKNPEPEPEPEPEEPAEIEIDTNADYYSTKDLEYELIDGLEFAKNDEYDQIDIYYFNDGVYTDDRYGAVDAKFYIGEKIKSEFENSDDSEICVKNHRKLLKINVVKQDQSYDEVMGIIDKINEIPN